MISNGTSATTEYYEAVEELTTSGSTTATKEYVTVGPIMLEKYNSTITYIVEDGQSSAVEELTTSGTIQGAKLYKPYGTVIYSTGSMPRDWEYTGQLLDASGLVYFKSRYYARDVGQFTSADKFEGTNRYLYVDGNPETRTDPTGRCFFVCAAIGAVVGAVGDYTVQVVQNVQQHGWSGSDFTNINVGQVVAWAGAGAIIGGTGGLALLGGAATLGLTGAAATTATSVGMGGLIGAGTGLVAGYMGGDRGTSLANDTSIGGIGGMLTSYLFAGLGGPIASKVPLIATLNGFIGAGESAVGDLLQGKPIDGTKAFVTGGADALLGGFFGAHPNHVWRLLGVSAEILANAAITKTSNQDGTFAPPTPPTVMPGPVQDPPIGFHYVRLI